MHPSLSRTEHRPWGLPDTRWTWRQSWCDLLFAHWPIDKKFLKPLVPKPLEIQEFDSTSWIGVVPFRMEGVMRRPFPDLPWISSFPELNLRIYVEYQGKPGVWFLSLDAANPLAVWAARRFFHLPYYWARMSVDCRDDGVRYESNRRFSDIAFCANFKPGSQPYEAKSGSLEHWLTERYCLYAYSPKGELFRTDIHHHPWQLQQAKTEIIKNDLFKPHGLTVEGPPAVLHYSKNIDVIIWPEIRVN